MNHPKVSVIVPIYGVEKYIGQCARSLMEQTLDDMEFIFVNDATKDESMKVLDRTLAEYPNRISQVKIIQHEVNLGLPAARRSGLQAASGSYFIHCDSDDWMDKEMYAAMYEKAISDNLDMVVCDFYTDPENGVIWRQYESDKSDYISDLIMSRSTVSNCNKLVKKSVVDWDCYIWSEDNMGEDIIAAIQYAYYSKQIGYIHTPFYYYRRRNDSISGTTSVEEVTKKIRQFRNNFDKVLAFLREKKIIDNYTDEIAHRALSLKNCYLPIINKMGMYEEWQETCSDYNKNILTASSITCKEKLIYLATYCHLYGLIKGNNCK